MDIHYGRSVFLVILLVVTGFSLPLLNRTYPPNRRNERYTIQVLPSPPKPSESKSHILPETLMNPHVGIGIVAESFDKTKFNSGYSNNKNVPTERRYFPNHVTIDVQFLPWGEGLKLNQGLNDCLDSVVISKAVRLALRRNPPPPGVTLVVHPPPKGNNSLLLRI